MKYFNKKQSDYISLISRKCKCGHTITFETRAKNKKCSYCGNLVFWDKKSEYDFKIKRRFLGSG